MKKRSSIVLALLLALTVILTSCGGGGSQQTQAPADQKPVDLKANEVVKATNPEKLPDEAKNRKDTLIVGIAEFEAKFLPIYSGTVYDSYVTSLAFDTLVSNDAKGEAVPNLAEKWEISPDGKTYTFHLKQGVKFINGTELTADDVAFTYTAMCDPTYDGPRIDAVTNLAGYEDYAKGKATSVSGIKVIDKYTISFTEAKVKASALLGDFIYGIMPKSVYDFPKGHIEKLKANLTKNIIGSGAYVFKSYKPAAEIDMEANPNYWKGAPKIKNIIMKVTTAQTNIQELKSGGTDIDRIPAKPENVQMLKDAGFLDLQFFPDNGYGFIGFNCRLPMFSDKRVRQALTYGLNRKGFVDAYFKGYSEVANVPIPTISWAYTDKINKYEYNPDKAKQLLDEAGWKVGSDGYRYKDGKKMTIHWMTYTGSKYVETLIPILKENWKQIGVEVVPELMDFGTLSTKVFDKQQFEMFNMAWSNSIDPDQSALFTKSQMGLGGFNCVGWTTPENEKLLADGLAETDQAKRKEIYQKWSELINDELPYIFLDSDKQLYAVSSRVKGIDISSYCDWTYYVYKAELAQ